MVGPADLWTLSVAIGCGQDYRDTVIVQEVTLMICAHLEFKYDFLTQLVSRISGSWERVSNLSCLVSLRVRVRVPGNSPATAYWT